MRPRIALALAAIACGLCPGIARAADPAQAHAATGPEAAHAADALNAPEAAPAVAAGHDFSLTLDVPYDTFFGAAAEVRLTDKWSAEGQMVLGKTSVPAAGVYELGAQGRYYVLGTFEHGLDLAAEASYIGVSADVDGKPASGTALMLAALVGYKYVAGFGLTVELQLGPGLMALRAQSEVPNDSYEKVVPSQVVFASHLRLGWSF